MGSVRDPGRAASEAAELARATNAARQPARQAAARRYREHRMKGNPTARRELAQDYAAVSPVEARRARRGPESGTP